MLHFNVWIKLNSFSLNFSWMGVVTVVAHHPRNTHTTPTPIQHTLHTLLQAYHAHSVLTH